MSIAAYGTPISKPEPNLPFVDPQTGTLTQQALQMLGQWRDFIVGMNRIIPCNASGSANVITLTPLIASPLLGGYVDYEIFSFVAANDSTGPVTATVVPRKGALATIKVYVTNGSAQATLGDIVTGRHYLAVYVSALDSAAGGLILK